MSAPAPHAVIMRRFAVIQNQLFPGLDVLLCIDLYMLSEDAHEHIGAAAVVQMAEYVPLRAVQRMGVVQVDEAHAALALGALSRRADGYDLAGDLADLCAARDGRGSEHTCSFDSAASRFYVVVKHVVTFPIQTNRKKDLRQDNRIKSDKTFFLKILSIPLSCQRLVLLNFIFLEQSKAAPKKVRLLS
jgi:hypothetical protein